MFPRLTAAAALMVSLAATLHGQTYQSVPALFFTKSFGGADPLPQNPTIAAVGAGFNFSVTSAMMTGGPAVTVSTITSCGLCATPRTISVAVTAPLATAVGTYTGQVVLTSQFGSVTLTIPITLNIVTAGATVVDNLPGQVSFSLITASTTPVSQTIQIRNAGSGTLSWTATKSTSDGGNWLTISSTSGSAPSFLTVGFVPANLPGGGLTAGTFVGQIVVQASSGNVTIPVSVVLGTNNLFSQVNPISFTKVFGGPNPLPQTLTIATPGTGFNFFVSAATANGGTWLAVTTAAACGLCATPNTIIATINASPTLPVGSYTGQIEITEQFGTQTITVPVTLTVAGVGTTYLDNLAGEMTFTMTTGGSTITTQDLQVRNGGSGTLNWTAAASTADGANWLSVSAPSGTAPSYITVAISVPNLPNAGLIAGTFVGQVVIQTTGSTVTVPISVVVGASVFSQVNPISFTKVFGATTNPLPQTLIIATPGTGFNYFVTFSTATGGAWLNVTTATACGLCATPNTVVATVIASPTLPIGIYTGQIVITSQFGTQSITVPVTLTVAAAATAFFDNVPGQMSFTMQTAGTTITSQTLQIRNAGVGTLNWTLEQSTADGGNWLTVSAPSGAAPSFVNVGVTVANLPSGGLLAGTFVGELVFRTAGSSVTVSVSVVVGAGIINQVNAISFAKPFAGANPLPQTITIATPGAAFNYFVNASTATGGAWLNVATVTACGLCTTPNAIVATVTASPTLPVGTYTGQIVVTSQFGAQTITVPVSLTVAAGGVPLFDNVPGEISFALPTGSGNPPTQNVQIRNAGSGTLTWALTATTSDGGNWLNVSVPVGSTPANVSVGVSVSALPNGGLIAGTFTGQLAFTSLVDGSVVTVPIVVTVGLNGFVQLNALSFSKPFGGSNPVSQIVNGASTGTAFNFFVQYTAGNGGSWLSVTTAGACGLCTTPKAVTVAITASPSLAVGTYTGQLVMYSQFGSMSMIVPVTLTVGNPGPPPGTPIARAALRDSSGEIQVGTYASSTLSNSGGSFASDPAIAEDLGGNAFVTARDSSNSTWTNVFNGSTFSGWTFGGGSSVGVPAIAVAPNGTSWIAVRDASGSYWLVSYTNGVGYGTWTPLGGVFITDPVIAACGDGSVYVSGKDSFMSMYSRRYIPGAGLQNWLVFGGQVTGKPSLSCGNDNAVYLVARDSFNSNWIARVTSNISGSTLTGWFNGGAQTSIDPKIAALGNGSEALVILDAGGSVWRNTYSEGAANGWQAWTSVGGGFSDISPAGVGGELFFSARAVNNDLWWWNQTGSLFTWIGNNGLAAGALAAAPK
jgi:hypothetical protein